MKTTHNRIKKTLAGILFATTAVAASSSIAADYVIDTKGAHASINFQVQHLGYSWLLGRFNNFSGNFSYDPKDIAASSINVTIDTTSIDSNHAERDKHLRSGDFLEVAKYPEATFVSKSISDIDDDGEEFNVVDDLTLRGVTKEITIEVEKIGEGQDPWGGYRVGFEGEAKITMKDFGITTDLGPASKMVEFKLHIEGIRQ